MRSARRITPLVALVLPLAVCLPAVATAQSVVRVVDVGDDDVSEKRSEVLDRAAPDVGGSDPYRSEAVAETPRPLVAVVVVNAEESPDTAWKLISPWEETGIRVHDHRGGDRFGIVIHSGTTARQASEMRVHGIGGERSNPSVIPTLAFGGRESRIKVHGMGSRGPSRIRVHGVAR